MVYGEFEDLPRRTASDKIFRDKVFNIAKNYDGSQRELASMVYTFLIKTPLVLLLTQGQELTLKTKNQQKKHTNQLPVRHKRRKIYSCSKDNFCNADLTNMKLITKYNIGILFSL